MCLLSNKIVNWGWYGHYKHGRSGYKFYSTPIAGLQYITSAKMIQYPAVDQRGSIGSDPDTTRGYLFKFFKGTEPMCRSLWPCNKGFSVSGAFEFGVLRRIPRLGKSKNRTTTCTECPTSKALFSIPLCTSWPCMTSAQRPHATTTHC